MTRNLPREYRALDKADVARLLLLASPILIFAFVLLEVTVHGVPDEIWVRLEDGFGPLLRSVVAATSTAVIVSLLSLWLASLAVYPIYSDWVAGTAIICLTLSFSVVALLIGPVSFSFLWQRAILSPFLQITNVDVHSFLGLVVIETIAQAMRYGPLLTWLLVIAALSVDRRTTLYGRQVGFRPSDMIRCVLVGPWTVILVVVAAFAFQDAFNDYIISFLALRPSPATNTELVAHFLDRLLLMTADSQSAFEALRTVLVGAASAAVVGVLTFGVLCGLPASLSILVRRRTQLGSNRQPRKIDSHTAFAATGWRLFVLVAIVGAFMVPLSLELLGMEKRFSNVASTLGGTIVLSLLASLSTWVVAGVVAYRMREAGRMDNGSATIKLCSVGLVAAVLGFIPTLGIAESVYTVLFSTLGPGGAAAFGGWFIAECLRLLPVIAFFMLPALFAVEDKFIEYLRHAGASFAQRIRSVFIFPLVAAHLAFVLVGWNWVVNEGVIGAIFQADIPSFPDLILRSTSGRSAAYTTAAALMFSQGILFATLCSAWGLVVFNFWYRRNAPYRAR